VVVTEAEEGKDSPALCVRSLQEACSVLQLSSILQLSPDSLAAHCSLCTVTSAGLVPIHAPPVQSPSHPREGSFLLHCITIKCSALSSPSTSFFTRLSDQGFMLL